MLAEASSATLSGGVSALVNKENSKNSSPSDTSSNDEFFRKGFQAYSHEPTYLQGSTDWKKKLITRKKLMTELAIQTGGNTGNAVPC